MYIIPDPAPQQAAMLSSPVSWSFLLSCRFGLCVLGLLGFTVEYAMRIDLSSALVCMLNHTAIDQAKENFSPVVAKPDPVCPVLNTTANADGPYVWTKDEQGTLLASFFYGYIITQIPFGILGLCTLLSPLAAGWGLYYLVACRVLLGMAEGALFPCMHSIWSHWAPPTERSILIGVCYSGTQLGNVLALSMSGFICETIGFEWIFYILGLFCMVWSVLWLLMAASTPSKHRWISNKERDFINESLIGQNTEEAHSVPWAAVATSMPNYAIIVMHFGTNFGNYLPMTELPTWMSVILRFNEASSGIWSSLPYILYFVTYCTSGYMADWIRGNGYLSTKNTRKLMMTISMVGQGSFFIGCAFVDCTQQMLGVALVTLAQGISGFYAGGYLVNHVDIAPRYAGTLFGISNMFATIPGIIAPYMTSALTPDDSNVEWMRVYLVASGIIFATLLFYLAFADGELQAWAAVVEDEHTRSGSVGSQPLNYESIGQTNSAYDEENKD